MSSSRGDKPEQIRVRAEEILRLRVEYKLLAGDALDMSLVSPTDWQAAIIQAAHEVYGRSAGAALGSQTSERKRAAAKVNGRKGGWPAGRARGPKVKKEPTT